MRRLLVVSYYAPPLGMSGVMRVAKLCKFLPEFGWQPLVLTVKPVAYYAYDPALLEDLKRARVFRTESVDPNRLMNLLRARKSRLTPVMEDGVGRLARVVNQFAVPDSKIGWLPFGSVSGRHIIDRERPSAIFATAPPFTSLLLGVRLKAHGHIPLVADFRDPWPTGFRPPPRWQRPLARYVRRYVLRHADLSLAVNEGTARAVGRGVHVLDNGFDPTDFEKPAHRFEGTSIVHVGNLWGISSEVQAFASALSRVAGATLHLVGPVDAVTKAALAANRQVVMHAALPHEQACAMMKGASALLYIGKPGQPVGIKLYEYIGAGRPVIIWGAGAVEAAGLAAAAGAGADCGTDEGKVVEFLKSAAQGRQSVPEEARERFNRRAQARWLASTLEELVVRS